MTLARNTASLLLTIAVASALSAEGPKDSSWKAQNRAQWKFAELPKPRDVQLRGPIGAALDRGLDRLKKAPYDNVKWIEADLSQSKDVERIFMDWSGDVSGRYIETISLASFPGKPATKLLPEILAALPGWQKADGHFGGEIGEPAKRLEVRQTPVFWGNARLLVSLVIAARELNQPQLLEPARRIADFFAATVDSVCTPAVEEQWKKEAQDSFSFVTDYFPAVEALALYSQTTADKRHLRAAERMAEFFLKFDREPNGHSHGNLTVWRGILELYHATGNPRYLELAVRKWQRVTGEGYVWPIGGSGEGWSRGGGLKNAVGGRSITEGCADSDWLRFNLELWRCTGQTRYLDLAERHLHNQFLADQARNGGHGHRPVLVDEEGQVTGLDGQAACDATWCCSLHGPLALEYLKSYLAAGSDRGVLVNFPLDFTAPVMCRGAAWTVTCQAKPDYLNGRAELDVELAPKNAAGPVPCRLCVRMPAWARSVKATDSRGASVSARIEDGSVHIERSFSAGEPVHLDFETSLRLESRRFRQVDIAPGKIVQVADAALTAGPCVLFAPALRSPTNLVLLSDAEGRLRPLAASEGRLLSLPVSPKMTPEHLQKLSSRAPVTLKPWSADIGSAVFMNHWLVVPESLLTDAARRHLASLASASAFSVYGDDLDKQPHLWNGPAGWSFTPDGLTIARKWAIKAEDSVVSCGGVGLLAGEEYRDYRFEFEFVLPKEGDGLTGFVVRANSPQSGILFQIESSDSQLTGKRPPHEQKTRPNTLRSYLVRSSEIGTQIDLKDVVPLSAPVRRGEAHRIAVACRSDDITVFLDGTKVHAQKAWGMTSGSVGFRAGGGIEDGSPGANELGVFRKIRLTKQ